MNKPKRFMIEYFNHLMREIESNPAMTDTAKAKLAGHYRGIVRAYRCGFITIDETMRLLASPCQDCEIA